MRDWYRTIEEIEMSDLPADCLTAVGIHLERYNLGEVLSQPTMVIRVVSNNIRKSLFRRKPKVVESYVVLTQLWLVWTVSTDGELPAVISAKLVDIHIEDYLENPHYALVRDNGLLIDGKLTGQVGMEGEEQVSMFIGLGDGPVAEQFKAVLWEAYKKSRR